MLLAEPAGATLPPIAEAGVEQALAALPTAVATGNYDGLVPLFGPDTVLRVARPDNIMATGAEQISRYFAQWFKEPASVRSVIPGNATVTVLFDRPFSWRGSRPTTQSFIITLWCKGGKVTQIDLIQRNTMLDNRVARQ